MLRLLASLLVALGLVFAPAMMTSVSAAGPTKQEASSAQAMDHCKGAAPAKHDGKPDMKPCCSTACPMTAAIPAAAAAPTPPRETLVALVLNPVFFGLEPERETPPPRPAPAI